MIKVKILQSDNSHHLEGLINDFLEMAEPDKCLQLRVNSFYSNGENIHVAYLVMKINGISIFDQLILKFSNFFLTFTMFQEGKITTAGAWQSKKRETK